MTVESDILSILFPNLIISSFSITSPRDPHYNCIAWAAGDLTRNWWPGLFSFYWPQNARNEENKYAFIEAFNTLGYVTCDSPNYEKNFEKIAIYFKNSIPKHASRQKSNGKWTSKIGQMEDIEHDFHGLDGDMYGKVEIIMKRNKQESNNLPEEITIDN